jgi:hypothetical protein
MRWGNPINRYKSTASGATRVESILEGIATEASELSTDPGW